MNELSRENPQEYFTKFTDMACARNEANFRELLEIAGIDSESFVNGDFIKNKLNGEVIQLKKRYGYKE